MVVRDAVLALGQLVGGAGAATATDCGVQAGGSCDAVLFGADVGQPLAGLLWGVRASDDGAAASLWAARACGGASSVEDVEAGGARYGCERPPLLR